MPSLAFTLNGKKIEAEIEPNITLLTLLREKLGLKGTKKGCGTGDCGACTVLVDGKTVNSCIYPAQDVEGATVVTIEGVAAADGTLDPIQQAFVENGAVQCGYCIPGMVLSAKALLDVTPDPTVDEIKRSISGNLCRCTGYAGIVRSIQDAAVRLKEAERDRHDA